MGEHRLVYFFSHDGSRQMIKARITDPKSIIVDMPDGTECKLEVAKKDSRVLAIVEGDIPTGGLSRGVEVIHGEILSGRMTVRVDDAYTKGAKSEEEPTHVVWRSRAYQSIRRHAILFQPGVPVLLRRYDHTTLRPYYVTVKLMWRQRGQAGREENDFEVYQIISL